MNKKKILVLVEGQTELGFVRNILSPYFKEIAVFIPTIITTKIVKSGSNFKGGITGYSRVKREVLKLLQDSSATIVTTMFDYYGLPKDFPGFDEQIGNCYQRVEFLEQAFGNDIKDAKFIPYFQLHEFEALLFSEPEAIDAVMIGNSNLREIRNAYKNPEEIDNSPITHPSRRILDVYPGYEKVLHGRMILEGINVNVLLGQCSHFSSWMQKMGRSNPI